jgi:HEAT repeat protein
MLPYSSKHRYTNALFCIICASSPACHADSDSKSESNFLLSQLSSRDILTRNQALKEINASNLLNDEDLKNAFRSSSWRLRKSVAWLAGHRRRTCAETWLQAGLKDNSDQVRGAVQIALKRISRDLSESVRFELLFLEPPDHRALDLELQFNNIIRNRDRMDRLLSDPSEFVRVAALAGMTFNSLADRDREYFRIRLETMIKDDTVSVKLSALKVLETLESVDSIFDPQSSPIWKFASGRDPLLKLQARQTLIKLADRASLRHKLELINSKDATRRYIGVTTLGEVSPDQFPIYIRLLNDDNNEVQLASLKYIRIRGLKESQIEESLVKILEIYDKGSTDVRLAVIRSIGNLNTISKPVISGLRYIVVNDGNKQVRDEAVLLLIDLLKRSRRDGGATLPWEKRNCLGAAS